MNLSTRYSITADGLTQVGRDGPVIVSAPQHLGVTYCAACKRCVADGRQLVIGEKIMPVCSFTCEQHTKTSHVWTT
jgi:hypothetical protein